MPNKNPSVLTTQQAADRLNLTRDTIHYYVRQGRLANVAPPGCRDILLSADEVAAFRRRPPGPVRRSGDGPAAAALPSE